MQLHSTHNIRQRLLRNINIVYIETAAPLDHWRLLRVNIYSYCCNYTLLRKTLEVFLFNNIHTNSLSSAAMGAFGCIYFQYHPIQLVE
jgi:hypothetical protein